jgi:hypothetical protein
MCNGDNAELSLIYWDWKALLIRKDLKNKHSMVGLYIEYLLK